jgi:hypothetical protein
LAVAIFASVQILSPSSALPQGFPLPPPAGCPTGLGNCIAQDPNGTIAVSPKLVSVGDVVQVGVARTDGDPVSINWASPPQGSLLLRPAIDGQNFMVGPLLTPLEACPTSATGCDFRVDAVATVTAVGFFGKTWVLLGASGFGEDYFGVQSNVVQGTVEDAQGNPLRVLIHFIQHHDSDTTSVYSRGPTTVFSSQTDGSYRVLLPPSRLFEAKIVTPGVCENTSSQFVTLTSDTTLNFVCGAPLEATIVATPETIALGDRFTVTMTAKNVGNAALTIVQPAGPLTLEGEGQAEIASGPVPVSVATLAPQASQAFVYQLDSTVGGALVVKGQVQGMTPQGDTITAEARCGVGALTSVRGSAPVTWDGAGAVCPVDGGTQVEIVPCRIDMTDISRPLEVFRIDPHGDSTAAPNPENPQGGT